MKTVKELGRVDQNESLRGERSRTQVREQDNKQYIDRRHLRSTGLLARKFGNLAPRVILNLFQDQLLELLIVYLVFVIHVGCVPCECVEVLLRELRRK